MNHTVPLSRGGADDPGATQWRTTEQTVAKGTSESRAEQ
jgi:hypothetical protein